MWARERVQKSRALHIYSRSIIEDLHTAHTRYLRGTRPCMPSTRHPLPPLHVRCAVRGLAFRLLSAAAACRRPGGWQVAARTFPNASSTRLAVRTVHRVVLVLVVDAIAVASRGGHQVRPARCSGDRSRLADRAAAPTCHRQRRLRPSPPTAPPSSDPSPTGFFSKTPHARFISMCCASGSSMCSMETAAGSSAWRRVGSSFAACISGRKAASRSRIAGRSGGRMGPPLADDDEAAITRRVHRLALPSSLHTHFARPHACLTHARPRALALDHGLNVGFDVGLAPAVLPLALARPRRSPAAGCR